MDRLISMTDFVLERNKPGYGGITLKIHSEYRSIIKYANFLKWPLHISMFVPCDFEGTPLQEPFFNENAPHYSTMSETYEKDKTEHIAYQKAKEKVLFDGYDLKLANIVLELGIEIIEDFVEHSPILTESAIKHIFS